MSVIKAIEHGVDPEFYSSLLLPSRTRSGDPAIKSIPIEKRRLSRNEIMKPYNRIYNIQGFAVSNVADADADAGKYYYIHINPYDTSPTTTRIINEVSPLLVNPTQFEKGAYYAYIVASIIGKDRETGKTVTLSQLPHQLYATRVINMYEFGVKHHQIFYRMVLRDEALFAELEKSYDNIEYRLYASGEIMCRSENTLLFNFYSGTYKMKKHISARRVKNEEAYIQYMMQEYASKYVNIRFQHCPFITTQTLSLTRKELARLRRHKIQMFLFDTQQQCNDMRNAVMLYKNTEKTTDIPDENLNKIYELQIERNKTQKW